MKIGSKDGKYYVGWYCHTARKVVYTWFEDFQQAMEFMQNNN